MSFKALLGPIKKYLFCQVQSYLNKLPGEFFKKAIQCPLDIETLDKAAALDLATSKAVTDLRQYINSNLGYSDLEI